MPELEKARDKVIERARNLVRLWANGWAEGPRPDMLESCLRDAVNELNELEESETEAAAPKARPAVIENPSVTERVALNNWLTKAGYRRSGDLVFLTPIKDMFTTEIRASEKAAVALIITETHEILAFDPQGARLDRFRKNPLVLYNHDYEGLPVARSLWERVRSGDQGPELVAKSQFHMDTELSREVWQLVVEGHLSAWELGVVPVEWRKRGEGYYVTKWDILEYSVVPRPEKMGVLRANRRTRRISSPALVKSILRDGETDV